MPYRVSATYQRVAWVAGTCVVALSFLNLIFFSSDGTRPANILLFGSYSPGPGAQEELWRQENRN